MDARRLERFHKRLYDTVPLRRWWSQPASARALAASGSPSAIRCLAVAVTNHPNLRLRQLAGSLLRSLRQPKLIDAVLAVWQETRHADLTALLRERRWIASHPMELRMLTALKIGQGKEVLAQGSEWIEVLVRAAEDPDPEIAAQALQILGGLRRPDDIEAICDQVVRLEQPVLRKLALEKNYLPREAPKRALYYFLMGQMDRYEALDFDQRLLRLNYETADDEIRNLIAARVRASGRAELALVIQGGQQKRQLTTMSSREWETVVSLLRSNRRHEDLWNLAFDSPPEWSSEILGLLKQAGFKPASEADRSAFDRLLKLRPLEGKNLRLFLPVPACQAVLRRHQQGVRTVAFAPDGKSLASVSYDTTTLLWDVFGLRLKTSLTKKIGLGLNAAFSPDGRILAVANIDNTARLWDTSTWQQRAAFHGHTDKISALRFSPEGEVLATASYDNTVRVWDLAAGQCRSVSRGHKGALLSLAFSPDGKSIATGSHDETVRFWYPLSGESKSTLAGLDGSVCALDFSPDGRILAAASSDGSVRLWNVGSGEVRATFPAHKGSVVSLAFSPDGTRLATAGIDRLVRLWDLTQFEVKATLQGHLDEVTAVAFSPDGKAIATASRDKTVRIWQVAYSKPLAAMTREDLDQINICSKTSPNSELAKPWHFVTALARHRFRFDIVLSETSERLFNEFDIEIEDLRGR